MSPATTINTGGQWEKLVRKMYSTICILVALHLYGHMYGEADTRTAISARLGLTHMVRWHLYLMYGHLMAHIIKDRKSPVLSGAVHQPKWKASATQYQDKGSRPGK